MLENQVAPLFVARRVLQAPSLLEVGRSPYPLLPLADRSLARFSHEHSEQALGLACRRLRPNYRAA